MLRYLLPLLLLKSLLLFAQNDSGILKGNITDQSTNEPLAGTNILIENTETGAASDVEGNFQIKLPFGIYTVKVSFIGYKFERQVIQLSKSHKVVELNIALQPEVLLEDEIMVTGKKSEPSTVVQSIEAQDLKMMPNLHHDALRSVQVFAGVSSNNELSSGYNVRGGSFDENLIYLNGFEIYRPFLLRQGVEESQTLINQDLVSSLNFYNGAFPATYGDKMSSALNVQYDLPDDDKYSTIFHADIFNLGVTNTGSYKSFKYGAAFRYAYPQLFSGTLQTRGDYDPTFSDFQFVGNYKISDETDIDLIGLYAQNKYTLKPEDWDGNFGGFIRGDFRSMIIDYEGSKKYSYNTAMAGIKFNHKFNESLNASIRISDYYTDEIETQDVTAEIFYNENAYSDTGYVYYKKRFQNADNKLVLNSFRLNANASYLTDDNKLTFGAEYRFVNLDNNVNERVNEVGDKTLLIYPVNIAFDNKISLNNFSAYFNNNYMITDRLILAAGLRYLRYEYSNENLISPRAQLMFLESNINTFTLNWGYYYQPPFINELRGLQDEGLKSQRAIHYVLGWERVLKPKLKVHAEIYYKDLDNLIPYYFDEIKSIYINGNTREGYAYGFDMQFDGEIVEGIRSILSYSYLNSKERDEGTSKYQRRLADQNHTLNVFLQDKMPKHPNWQSHLKFLLGSGILYYNRNIVIDEATGHKTIQVDLNKPEEFFVYFRVDMGVSANFDISDDSKLLVIAEVLNVFNQHNYGSYDWLQVFPDYDYLVAIPRVLSSRFFNLRVEFML